MNRRNFMKSFLMSLGGTTLFASGAYSKDTVSEAVKEISPQLPLNFEFVVNEKGVLEIVEKETKEKIGGVRNVRWDIGVNTELSATLDIVFFKTYRDILPL